MNNAEKTAQTMKDEYVSVEHIILAFLDCGGDAGALLKQHGVNKNAFLKAAAKRSR